MTRSKKTKISESAAKISQTKYKNGNANMYA